LADARPIPEAELLVCCARTVLDHAAAERIRALLARGIDWAYLLQVAPRHGMVPLLYWHLSATCPEAVPPECFQRLHDYFHSNCLGNLRLTAELLELLKQFEARAIPVLCYKGAALVALAYHNLALRQFADVDLLVRQQDVSRAQDLLVARGYRPRVRLTPGQEWVYGRFEIARAFIHDESAGLVELHWELLPRYFSLSLDPEDVWGRLHAAALDGHALPTLTPEVALLFLCVHGAKHCWSRLGWICDVACTIGAHPRIDWPWVLEAARRRGCRRMLLLGLLLVRDLLGLALPEAVRDPVQVDPVAQELARKIVARFLEAPDRPLRVFERGLFLLRVRERLRDRARLCLLLAVTPNEGDLAFVRLPAVLCFLYYLVRPIRLVARYGPRLFARA
jgi:hypothetical protein